MSMHLCGPALTMTGKKKGKIKFKNATEAKRARDLAADWKQLKHRWGVDTEEKKRSRGLASEKLTTNTLTYRGADAPRIPSLNSGLGTTALVPSKVYTGDNCLGISTLHKSNAVPVFRQEDIVDIARMRR